MSSTSCPSSREIHIKHRHCIVRYLSKSYQASVQTRDLSDTRHARASSNLGILTTTKFTYSRSELRLSPLPFSLCPTYVLPSEQNNLCFRIVQRIFGQRRQILSIRASEQWVEEPNMAVPLCWMLFGSSKAAKTIVQGQYCRP